MTFSVTRLLQASAFITVLITAPSWAKWEYLSFKSGSLQHSIAMADKASNGREMEIFCSLSNPQPTLAIYLPEQRFRQRKPVEIEVRIDQKRIWTLPAYRHAMAIITLETPSALLEQLAEGSKVRITFPLSTKSRATEIFPLTRSAKALSDMKNNCKV